MKREDQAKLIDYWSKTAKHDYKTMQGLFQKVMSQIEAKEVVKKFAKKLKAENYPFSALYLFGSFAKGTEHEWSDIDVAVISTEMTKNRWKGRTRLWQLKSSVDIRIEPHGFSPEDFKQDWMPMVHEIKKTGIRIR